MKRILFIVFLVVMAFIWVNRQRVYLRDPLATVYKNGVKQSGVQVFMNYSNEVLVEQDGGRILVQGWNKMPATPVELTCLRWTACMTDAVHAGTLPVEWNGKGKYDPQVAMTSREISYVDGDGAAVRVVLR